MLGVFAFGSEYGWDTLKALFTQGSGRLRVFAAKLSALGIALMSFTETIAAGRAFARPDLERPENTEVHPKILRCSAAS